MEILPRIGRNQFFGTLFLIFIAVFFSAHLPFLQFLLPDLNATDMGVLWTRMLILISVGYFVGFVFEQAVNTLQQRATGAVCALWLGRKKRSYFELQDANLNQVLQEDEVLRSILRGKASVAQFFAAAKHLSQERFKDFPELSPWFSFEKAATYSVASAIIVVLVVLGIIQAGLDRWASLDVVRIVILFAYSLLSLLLFAAARHHYEEGREDTLISLREKVAEARERREATELALASSRSQDKFLSALSPDVAREILNEVSSDKRGDTLVGVSRLKNLIGDSPSLFASRHADFDILVDIFREADVLLKKNDLRALDTLLGAGKLLVEITESPRLYKELEGVLTPILIDYLSRHDIKAPAFQSVLAIAADFRSQSLATTIMSFTEKVPPKDVIGTLRLDQVLGTSVLGHSNRDSVILAIKRITAFAKEPQLRVVADNLLSRLERPDEYRRSWPKVLRSAGI